MKQTALPPSSYLKALQSEKSPRRSIDCAPAPASGAPRAAARVKAARRRREKLVGMIRSDGGLFRGRVNITGDRKSAVQGKSVAVRVDLGVLHSRKKQHKVIVRENRKVKLNKQT